MIILGCDFHPSWQQVSWLDTGTGETDEQKLVHAEGQAQQFYRALSAPVLIGMEATGNSQWFVELVEDLGHEILMTQPGVGPNTALAFVLTIGDVTRFQRGKQVASYLGLIPREESSGGRQKLGAITKQGNRLLRSLLVEAAGIAVRYDAQFRKQYLHRCHAKPKALAKVAAARKLAVRLYWMLRTQTAYPEIVRIESSSRVALVGAS